MAAAGALMLAGCQQVADEPPATAQAPVETVAGPAEAPPASAYPPLQSVPPRPQLSYTVQQQRQIVEALVADRENARYTSQVVRYRSGLSSLPPPPAPPEKVAVALPAVEADAPAAGAPRLARQETLVDFLASLKQRMFADEPEPAAPTPPTSAPEAAAPTPEPPAQAIAPVEPDLAPAPMPPARSAVAARMAARPQPVDELLDDSIAQAPLPPGQTAVVARQEESPQAETAPPLPVPRPAVILTTVVLPSARPLVPAPPPIKPVVPVRTLDGESASLLPRGHAGPLALASGRQKILVADVAS